MNPDGSYSKPKKASKAFSDSAGEADYKNGVRNDSAGVPAPAREIPATPSKKRIRQNPKPLMNKLETEFYRILCTRHGEKRVKPQAMRLSLGNGINYKPDFTVLGVSCEQSFFAYEVKGPHAFRGGLENLKVAAHQWPEITFILAWKENGQWVEQRVLP